MTVTTAPVLEITRLFDATPQAVFDAWLTREEWQAWIGPEGCQSDVTLLEPHVGGKYRILMRLPDGSELPVVGVFREVDRPNRFAFTWKWELGEGDTLITISLRAAGGQTELTLRHEGLGTEEACEKHKWGWNSAMNKLAAYLAA